MDIVGNHSRMYEISLSSTAEREDKEVSYADSTLGLHVLEVGNTELLDRPQAQVERLRTREGKEPLSSIS